jgi:hypothetical protein
MTSMENVSDVESTRTATLRRVGRNLVNAQRIELMLKFLLKMTFSSPLGAIEGNFKKHVERVSRKTMGVLIPELAETMLLPVDAAASMDSVKEVWLATSVNVPMDPEGRSAWNKEWETLRTERNRLVHLMLGNVDFNSPDQCRKLDLELDAQNGLFLNGIEFLGPIVTATRAKIAELASGELMFDPPLPDEP